MARRRHDREDWIFSPAELLEQSFALLRALPWTALVWCVAGPAPFVLALLFFWPEMSRPAGAATLPAWAAALAVLFAWMKIAQALFSREIWKCLLPDGVPALSAGGFWRRTGALLAMSAVSLPLQFIAANLLVPFVWVYATFQNATLFAYTQEIEPRPLRRLFGLSARMSHHEPLAHHLLLLQLIIFSCVVWGSVFATGLTLAILAKMLTGVENSFSLNPMAAAFSSLYLAVTMSVTWMIVSPFFRAACALRAFHVLARETGADLRGRLQGIKRRASSLAATAAMLLAFWSAAVPADAQENTATPPAGAQSGETSAAAGAPSAYQPATSAEKIVDAAGHKAVVFGEAIRQTLAQKEYQWRVPTGARSKEKNGENSLVGLIKKFFQGVRSVFRDFDSLMTDIIDFFRKLFGKSAPSTTPDLGTGSGLNASALRGLVYLLGVVLLGVLLFFIARHFIRRRQPAMSGSAAGPLAAPVDLENEETLASQLPEDQWLRLAREQLDGGDLRLAVRALFLAILASLGEQRLIEIARSKSNRDYREELGFRAASRREVAELFGQSVGVFERVWYGLHDALPQWVQQLMDNYERIKSSRAPAS